MKKNLFDAFGMCLMAFVLGSCLFVVSGCPSLGHVEQPIDASNVAPLWNKVLDTYDGYLVEDADLSDIERSALELDSSLLRSILEKALGSGE